MAATQLDWRQSDSGARGPSHIHKSGVSKCVCGGKETVPHFTEKETEAQTD